jgi:putative MATE family efflux protein
MTYLRNLLSTIDMTQGAPWKNLLLFTIPLLIGNLFQQLYGTADAIVLGRFVGDSALAAVGASVPIHFLIFVLMMGVAMGAGVMVSQYFGAKAREDLSHTVGTCITLTTILGALLMVFGPLLTRPLLRLLQTPDEIIDDSSLYTNILLWGILGMSYYNMLSGILRGMGDALSPLVYLAVACVLNVTLNLLFIPVLGWGVWGAAVGTVLAQGFTGVLCFRRLFRMGDVFSFKPYYLIPRKKYVLQVLRLGIPTGASQAVFAVAMIIIQPLANGFGALFLAANVIIMRIDGFVMMPNFSFGNAMTVFSGQNVGAKRLDRLAVGTRHGLLMAGLTAAVLVTAILIFGRAIAGAFTQTPEVIDMAVRFLWILAAGYVIFSVNMVLWGVIRGAGDAMTPMWAALVNTLVIRLPSAYLFVYIIKRPEALFLSLLLGWTTNVLLAVFAYKFGRWRTKGIT